MKIHPSRKAGFTLVEIMIVVAIIGMLATIAIPNYARARATSQSNVCINNKRQIDSAIQQWAIETKQPGSANPAGAALQDYMRGARMPTCPVGDVTYTIGGSVNAPSIVCGNESGTSHVLP